MLLVHAHPDDETIGNGATMARYAAEGVDVVLVTATRGEQGEVIPATLAHLVGAGAGPDDLGDHRVGELSAAMKCLGVADHRFLGDPASPGRTVAEVLAAGARVYRDSGMAYAPDGRVVPAPVSPEGAFARADPDEPAGRLAALIDELRPQVVVTYEPGGGYGHPDHVQSHRVTMRALDLAVHHRVPKVYWSVLPASVARTMLTGDRMPSEVVPDEQVTTVVEAGAFAAAKLAALRAHATQIEAGGDGGSYALSNGVRRPVTGTEYYRLVRGEPAGPRDAAGRETDLFAGLPA